ncbi:MAG: zinc ribbon domain-containing protein [Terriglobales bacterium]
MEVLILIVWLGLCGAAAYIAENKGRSGLGIFFLSFFLSPLIGIIVALGMRADETKVAIRQNKKKCPNCAEFVQPDAKTCRFCQYSFVDEETAQHARLEEERPKREAEEAERLATVARRQAEWEAEQAAKPWLRRHGAPVATVGVLLCLCGMTWYSVEHPPQKVSVSASESTPTIPPPIDEERRETPKSVWDKKVAWATQHHCYFFAMSRDETVRALGQPTEEQSFALTYKRQTKDCARYDGDVCAEHETDQSIVLIRDGYIDPEVNRRTDGCRTLYGENEYFGLTIPNFTSRNK